MSCCGTAAVVVGVEYVGLGGTAGSRFKGSVRDGLNSVVADFAVGSRIKGSVREGLDGAVGAVLVLAHGSRDLYGMVLTARSGRGLPSAHGSRDQYGMV
jgi:hypothetical protein